MGILLGKQNVQNVKVNTNIIATDLHFPEFVSCPCCSRNKVINSKGYSKKKQKNMSSVIGCSTYLCVLLTPVILQKQFTFTV